MSIPWSRFVTSESWPAGAVERLQRLRDMQDALEARASDYMMPDVMKTGGVIGWLPRSPRFHQIGVSQRM